MSSSQDGLLWPPSLKLPATSAPTGMTNLLLLFNFSHWQRHLLSRVSSILIHFLLSERKLHETKVVSVLMTAVCPESRWETGTMDEWISELYICYISLKLDLLLSPLSRWWAGRSEVVCFHFCFWLICLQYLRTGEPRGGTPAQALSFPVPCCLNSHPEGNKAIQWQTWLSQHCCLYSRCP